MRSLERQLDQLRQQWNVSEDFVAFCEDQLREAYDRGFMDAERLHVIARNATSTPRRSD